MWAFIGKVTVAYILIRFLVSLSKGLYSTLIAPVLRLHINFNKTGKWAVVTGATDGIGKAYVFELAKRGLDIVLISRTTSKLQAVAAEIKDKYPVETKIITADFTRLDIYDNIAKELAGMDIGVLINNVGMSYDHPEYLHKVPDAIDFTNSMVNMNITSVVRMTLIVLPGMVERKRGAIVNVSSLSAIVTAPLLTVYAASKAFVDKFSAGLEREVQGNGVTVQCIIPGFVVSKLSRINRPSFQVPTPEAYVKQTIGTLGVESHTAGYSVHKVMVYIIGLLPSFVVEMLSAKELHGIRQKLDGQQAYLMTESLQQFVLLGEGAGSAPPVKVMRVVASAPPPDLNGRLAVTLHATQDTSAHLKSATALERSRGASLLDKPKKFYLHDNGADLVFSLEEITAGWKLSQDNFIQEIPFDSLWSGGEDCSPWACATFLLERIDGLSTSNRSSTLSCRVMAEQRGASSVSVARVNTDFPYAPVTDSPAHVLLRPSTVSSAAGSPLVTLSGDPRPVRLPGRLRRELCRCLDPPNARGNDWRMLAARLNVDRYLNYFACKNSPTEHILDLWEARHREPSAATDLLNVLRVMGRPDAAHVLESHTGPWI
ncbi:Death domain [Trinorchestia longiramus]|nr:Death domain [Trinorchestia longiramus]